MYGFVLCQYLSAGDTVKVIYVKLQSVATLHLSTSVAGAEKNIL